MIRATSNNVLNILFRGNANPNKYWKIVKDDGDGCLKYVFCDEYGNSLSGVSQTWKTDYYTASLYAYRELVPEELLELSPVVRKIRQMERKYANRHDCRG